MGDERGSHGHQRLILEDREVTPLKVIDRGVFHGQVIVPILQGTGKTVVPGIALDSPDGREGLGGYHSFSLSTPFYCRSELAVARELAPARLRSSRRLLGVLRTPAQASLLATASSLLQVN